MSSKPRDASQLTTSGAAKEPGSAKKSKAASPSKTDTTPTAADTSKPQYGRRASRKSSKAGEDDNKDGGWFGTDAKDNTGNSRVKDAVPQNLQTVGDEDVNATASAALLAKHKQAKEKLAQAVAEAPTGYQAQMPRLTDLDIKNNWDRLLQSIHGEFDMSCLTACLARELDEDVAWNPEMLLVQLTSDMHDAAELKAEEAHFMPVEDSEIGLMTGGEVTRKRKEKGPENESPQVPRANNSKAASPSHRRDSNAGSKAASPSHRKDSTAAATKSPRKKGTANASGGVGTGGPVQQAPRKLSAKESSPRKSNDGSVHKAAAAAAARRKSKDSTTQLRQKPEL